MSPKLAKEFYDRKFRALGHILQGCWTPQEVFPDALHPSVVDNGMYIRLTSNSGDNRIISPNFYTWEQAYDWLGPFLDGVYLGVSLQYTKVVNTNESFEDLGD